MKSEENGSRYVIIIFSYLATCIIWGAVAYWFAPSIINDAYLGRSYRLFNGIFDGHRSQPIEYYLGIWNGYAAAVVIAAIAHLMIFLFIGRIDRNRAVCIDDSPKKINNILLIFSAAFLAVTVLTGSIGDYIFYVFEWNSINHGHNPYDQYYSGGQFNAYGPAFNALSQLIRLSPLAVKVICASLYLSYAVWLIKELGPRSSTDVPTRIAFGLLIFNLYPWLLIACYGYFDVLVGLTCVASIHSLSRRREGFSGAILGVGILLKFMPIVILPFLAIGRRQIHARLILSCIALVIGGFVTSVFFWGKSTFAPVVFAGTRPSELSVYDLMYANYFPMRSLFDEKNIVLMSSLISAIFGITLFVWFIKNNIDKKFGCTMAIAITILTYRVGFVHYGIAIFCTINYLIFSKWGDFKERSFIIYIFIVYFNFQAIANICMWTGSYQYVSESAFVLVNFILGVSIFLYLGVIASSLRTSPQSVLGGVNG